MEGLNEAAYGLLRNRGEIAGSQSGSGLAEALEKMGQLARQQGDLNAQAGNLMPQMSERGDALAEQLRQIAREQQALADALQRLGQEEGAPGDPEELAEEAGELARELDQGRLDPQTLERLEKLFHRLLDAGRTLEGEEPDPEKDRISETARAQDPRVPVTDPNAIRSGVRYRYPTWEELKGLSPDERRLVLDYFRRLNNAGRGR